MFRQLKLRVCVGAVLIGLGSAGALAQDATVADPWQGVEPQVLTDQQFQDVLGVMTAMRDDNVTIDAPEGTSADDQIAVVKQNADAMKILADHGYTPETFHPVVVNATIALGMADAEKRRQEIENAIEDLKAQKDVLPAAQFDEAMAQMTKQLAVLDNVPQENITLAGKHQDAFAALRSATQ